MATIEKQVLRKGPFGELIADAVRVGDTVHLSGAVAVDEKGEPLHPGDLEAQMRQCYRSIEATLGEFDADLSNIVDETWFVTDVESAMANLDSLFGARAEAFGGPPAITQTCVEVSSLVMPGLVIEIKVVARV